MFFRSNKIKYTRRVKSVKAITCSLIKGSLIVQFNNSRVVTNGKEAGGGGGEGYFLFTVLNGLNARQL